MTAECRLNVWMLTFTQSLIEDLSDEQLYMHVGTTNPPAWILGHLAAEADKALTTLGEKQMLPADWHGAYLQGSSPDTAKACYSKHELWQANEAVYAALRQTVLKLPSERLQESSHSDFLREHLPTRGDWLGHILTTHVAMHAGQVQYWRRLQGLGRGFEK
ncbi:MAG: DinB family protein [Ignavibacteria bacterium]|nr:DinB family protein [Ignavibacteria bacterium]MBL7991382.1 DinB family protein [Candidatus Kapabacteria bacterium]